VGRSLLLFSAALAEAWEKKGSVDLALVQWSLRALKGRIGEDGLRKDMRYVESVSKGSAPDILGSFSSSPGGPHAVTTLECSDG
jgi:hypothetical protein